MASRVLKDGWGGTYVVWRKAAIRAPGDAAQRDVACREINGVIGAEG